VTSRPPLERLLETGLYVADLAASMRFYADVLGGDVLLDTDRLVALSIGGESVLLLFQRGATLDAMPTPGGMVPGHGAEGIQHIAFAVPGDSLPAWRDRLRDAGVGVESEVDWPRGGRSIYLRDPDGHSIELLTRGLWTIY
jgi:catechol 2,3-dioxygenase-like lactoylglutathione lyase family enzyme